MRGRGDERVGATAEMPDQREQTEEVRCSRRHTSWGKGDVETQGRINIEEVMQASRGRK